MTGNAERTTETGALPEGWEEADLEEFTNITLGQSPPSSSYNTEEQGLPFFQGKAEFNDVYPTVKKWCAAPSKIALEGDVLLSVRAPVGPTNIAPAKSCIGRGLAAIRGLGEIETKFILYQLRAFQDNLALRATGTTFPAVTGKTVKLFRLPLPPLNEQRRIVEKIEELFTRLDAGVESLKKTQALLRKYRQSVLKAAVTGELSREWREENSEDLEPASELLQRILKERREKWSGKKYREPTPPETTDLPELPERWVWASLEQLSWASGYGTSAKCSYDSNSFPVLRIPNVSAGSLRFEDMKFATSSDNLKSEAVLAPGDLLIIRTNGSKNLIGRAAIVEHPMERDYYFASYLIRYRLLGGSSLRQWLATIWHSYRIRRWIEVTAATSAGQYNISVGSLNTLTIPIPPRAEAGFIVGEVERRLSVIDSLEATVGENLKRAEGLRQSILKRAFSGRLVPQDPSDEPASVLLERIRAERLAADAKPKKKRRSGRGDTPEEGSLFSGSPG